MFVKAYFHTSLNLYPGWLKKCKERRRLLHNNPFFMKSYAFFSSKFKLKKENVQIYNYYPILMGSNIFRDIFTKDTQ